MAWVMLVLAGCEEVLAVYFMKIVAKTGAKWPYIGMSLGFLLSFYCLAQAMSAIPAGVAYAVWAGVGTLGIMLLGKFVFKETYTAVQWLFLAMVVTGIVGLKFST